ncbi:MAG: amino acid ABC transporter substrate-binding protein, partial [Deferribacteres bacterium]|nr:amino acid ABC transporter substrate-binding protein [Deferribacteres bacterium]
MKRRRLVVLVVLLYMVSFVSSATAAKSILDEVKKRGVVRIGSGTTVPPV